MSNLTTLGFLVTGGETFVADTESYSSGEALRGSGVLRSSEALRGSGEAVRVSSDVTRIPIAVKTLIRGDATMTSGGARSTGTRMKEKSKAKRFAVSDGGRRITIENERKSNTRSSAGQASIEAGRFVTHDQGRRMSSEASRTEQGTGEAKEATRRPTEAVIKGTLKKPPPSEALIEAKSEGRGVPSHTTREPFKAAKPPVTEATSSEGVSEEDMRELRMRNSLLMARLSVIGTSAFMSNLDMDQSSSSSSS